MGRLLSVGIGLRLCIVSEDGGCGYNILFGGLGVEAMYCLLSVGLELCFVCGPAGSWSYVLFVCLGIKDMYCLCGLWFWVSSRGLVFHTCALLTT